MNTSLQRNLNLPIIVIKNMINLQVLIFLFPGKKERSHSDYRKGAMFLILAKVTTCLLLHEEVKSKGSTRF